MSDNCVRVVAVGDISPGDHYFSMGHGVGAAIKKNGVQSLLKEIRPYFNAADIVIANLEGVLSSYSCKLRDSVEGFVFRGDENLACGLKASGVNVVNVANNHMLQHGVKAWNNTIKSLELAGIAVVGRRGDGGFLSQPAFIDVKGAKIAILGYSAVPEVYFPENDMYAVADQASILRDVRSCQGSVNLVIVSLHAGVEGCSLPEYELVARCRQIADAGANIVLAHHAHVFHPVENYQGSCIAYGLGDFLFDLLWDDSLVDSALVTIDIRANNGEIESIGITPVKIGADMVVRKMHGESKVKFLDQLSEIEGYLLEGKNKYYERFRCKMKLDVARLESKKLPYLLKNIYRGNTWKKLHFLVRKLINRASAGV